MRRNVEHSHPHSQLPRERMEENSNTWGLCVSYVREERMLGGGGWRKRRPHKADCQADTRNLCAPVAQSAKRKLITVPLHRRISAG